MGSVENFIYPICDQMRPLIICIRFPKQIFRLECTTERTDFSTHLSKRCVPIPTRSYVSLGQRTAPQYCDVQGKEKKSQEQQQFRRQSHHPFYATALGSLRCCRSADSASSLCRDSNLRIRRGRGAATPLGSHFGSQERKKMKGKVSESDVAE